VLNVGPLFTTSPRGHARTKRSQHVQTSAAKMDGDGEICQTKMLLTRARLINGRWHAHCVGEHTLGLGRGSKVNFVTPLLSVQAVFALSNPALVLARGVYVTQTPLVARQAAFASPNTARVV
jgi:hypothetical protein